MVYNVVPKEVVLAIWQEYSGLRLTSEHKRLFFKKCVPLTRVNYKALFYAFEKARKPEDFKLKTLLSNTKAYSIKQIIKQKQLDNSLAKNPTSGDSRKNKFKPFNMGSASYEADLARASGDDPRNNRFDFKPSKDVTRGLQKKISLRERQYLKGSAMFREEKYPF